MTKEELVCMYDQLKSLYKVKNIIDEKRKVIFVLESPHIDELLHEVPVAGSSGKAMNKVLFGRQEAMGIQLKKEKETKKDFSLGNIGVMNVCSIPMQRSAYSNVNVINKYGEDTRDFESFFDVIEKIRTNTKSIYKSESKNILQHLIINDFIIELEKMRQKNAFFIPCGKTAETFFKIANVQSDTWTVLNNVPHPSFGNWHKQKYKSCIKDIVEVMNIIKQ